MLVWVARYLYIYSQFKLQILAWVLLLVYIYNSPAKPSLGVSYSTALWILIFLILVIIINSFNKLLKYKSYLFIGQGSKLLNEQC